MVASYEVRKGVPHGIEQSHHICLPDDYHTKVGERGFSLSGGERQRVAIAHRLSTLRNATGLVVPDKGRIAEVGTHDELIEKHGIYYGPVMAQREMSKMEPIPNLHNHRATARQQTGDTV